MWRIFKYHRNPFSSWMITVIVYGLVGTCLLLSFKIMWPLLRSKPARMVEWKETETVSAERRLAIIREERELLKHHHNIWLNNLSSLPAPVDDHIANQFSIAKIKNIHFEPFEFILEPRVCTNKALKYSLIVYIMTSDTRPEDAQTRTVIRRSWGKDLVERGIQVVFVLGRNYKVGSVADIERVLPEYRQYGDVLMANFRDSWDHLIHKWWSVMHYHAFHCSNIARLIFCDGDTVLFAENIIHFDQFVFPTFNDSIGCMVIGGQPVERGEDSRYYVAKHQWPDDQLPEYCSGALEMVSTETAGRLSHGVIELGIGYVLSFKIFDVITGAVAKTVGVRLKDLPGLFPWLPVQDVCLKAMFALHGIKPIENVPLFLTYRRRCCAPVWNGTEKNKKCPFNGTLLE